MVIQSHRGKRSPGLRGLSCWAKGHRGLAHSAQPAAVRLPALLPTVMGLPSVPSSPRRLHSNHLYCDCHLAWLSDWLRQRRTIGQFTLCMAPVHLRGFNVADVQKKEYVCPGEPTARPPCAATPPPRLPRRHPGLGHTPQPRAWCGTPWVIPALHSHLRGSRRDALVIC